MRYGAGPSLPDSLIGSSERTTRQEIYRELLVGAERIAELEELELESHVLGRVAGGATRDELLSVLEENRRRWVRFLTHPIWEEVPGDSGTV